MSAAELLARGRGAAEALMADTVTITRVTGQTTDPQTGAVVSTLATIYAGPGRIQRAPSGGIPRPALVGGAQYYQQPVTISVPTTVAGVRVDDTVTVTASTLDTDLVGSAYWVKGLGSKTHATAHRLECEEVLG